MTQIVNIKFLVSQEELDFAAIGSDIIELKKESKEQQLREEVARLQSQESRNTFHVKGEWQQKEVNSRIYYSLTDYLFLTSIDDAAVGEIVRIDDGSSLMPPQDETMQITYRDAPNRIFKRIGESNKTWERIY